MWRGDGAAIAGRRSLSAETTAAIREVLSGRWRGPRSALLFAGPAVIASVAYTDPGNFATNVEAGARFGYALLWVVLLANLTAMLFQSLSAKLGIATGRSLAEMCRDEFPRPLVYAMWAISEMAAMATDLAELLGGALGLSLLFRIPLIAAVAAAAVVTYLLLVVERAGFRPIELVIGGFVAVTGLCYVIEMFIAPVDWGAAGAGAVVPALANGQAVAIAVGIVGATVMPHAVYLHSGLTQGRVVPRNAGERRSLLRFSNREVLVALAFAGLVNMAMLAMAAAAFHAGHPEVAELGTAFRTLGPLLGGAAAGAFLASLIASGISSSAVGTMAGQVIMQGFTRRRLPLWLRRLLTMLPALVVALCGVNATEALVASQIVLSFALPVPVVALVLFTRRRDIMGEFANGRLTDLAAIAATAAILGLNALLLAQSLGVRLPILG